ncbi:hypothetical protein ACFLQZ_01080 [Acidobacteriota bacterium]
MARWYLIPERMEVKWGGWEETRIFALRERYLVLGIAPLGKRKVVSHHFTENSFLKSRFWNLNILFKV